MSTAVVALNSRPPRQRRRQLPTRPARSDTKREDLLAIARCGPSLQRGTDTLVCAGSREGLVVETSRVPQVASSLRYQTSHRCDCNESPTLGNPAAGSHRDRTTQPHRKRGHAIARRPDADPIRVDAGKSRVDAGNVCVGVNKLSVDLNTLGAGVNRNLLPSTSPVLVSTSSLLGPTSQMLPSTSLVLASTS